MSAGASAAPSAAGGTGTATRDGATRDSIIRDSPARAAAVRGAARPGLLDRPLTDYYLVLGITMLLLAIGLVMVLSTSSAQELTQGGATYAGFQKQLLGVLIGLPVMWIASRSAPGLFRALAYPLMALSVLGLILVLLIGHSAYGAERWIVIMGIEVQPSEFAKLAFVFWGADLLARKERIDSLREWRQLLIPLLPGAAFLSMLVMLGDDQGTTFILLLIFLALLWVIGTPLRLFVAMLALMAFAMVILVIVAPYRIDRITGFINPQQLSTTAGWQEIQGTQAIGSGGLFGVGLGAGSAKWGWVPNSTTDFIFAILGQEMGLVGTMCVVFLYGGLAFAGLRIARRVRDTFMRLAAAAATGWIVGQALVNMGAVIGMLPITGVPLPLVSAGLSSLLVTLAALGMLMSFAKREPGASQALAAGGPGPAARALSWLGLPGGRPGAVAPGQRRGPGRPQTKPT